MNGMHPYRWLWHHGYWDGPLSGVAEGPNGDHFWFSTKNDHWRHRTYDYYPLTEDEFRLAAAHHVSFCEGVGTHTTYVYSDDGCRSVVRSPINPDMQKWYDQKTDLPDFTDRPSVYSESRSPHNRRNRSSRYWERERAA